FFYHLMVAAMMLVVVMQHVIFFLVVWEVMSLSSTILVLFEREKKDVVDAAIFYTVAMHVGVACLLVGFIILSVKGGGNNLSEIFSVLAAHDKTAKTVLALLCIGFGIKAGFVPLHGWLPRAHPAAPSHVSALMSGVMIKMGLYGILRTIFLYGKADFALSLIFILVSLATAVFGVMNAMTCRDMKKLLAYSSIENMGIIGVGVGFGMLGMAKGFDAVALLGFGGALFHAFNHMLFKSSLFYGAGAVYQQTHTRDMEKLGGLVKVMPVVAFLVLCGTIAISALPPFNGFAGEFVIIRGMLSALASSDSYVAILAIGSVSVLGLVGGMAVITFSKFFAIPFLGSPRSTAIHSAEEPSFIMIVPIVFLVSISFLFGLFPEYVFKPLQTISGFITSGGNDLAHYSDTISISLKKISIGSLLFVCATCGILLLRKMLLRNRPVVFEATWGCGYRAGSARVQYTGHSFIQPFVTLAGSLSGVKNIKELPQGLFPRTARFASKGIDAVDQAVMNPLLRMLDKLFSRAFGLQTGRVQIYVLYGFIFLIAVLVYTMVAGQ
ncbi:MAG TPA: proton-conducting transporter membrane subunit, partial [Spirochaetota bacterium]